MSDARAISTAGLPSRAGQRHVWRGLHGSSAALAVVQAARQFDGLTLLLARSGHTAQVWEQDLRLFAGESLDITHFPDWETLPYDPFSPHPDIISERLAALAALPGLKRGILVVPVATLMQRIAPASYILGNWIEIRQGEMLSLDDLRRRLTLAGYRQDEQVYQPGQYAVRGGLLDLYPMGAGEPYRIELFDEEVESIRSFDPDSQLTRERYPEIRFLPAREYPFDDAAVSAFRQAFRLRFDIDTRKSPMYQDLRQGIHPQGLEYYLPLFFENTATLFDYLPASVAVVQQEGVGEAATRFWQALNERYEQRRHDLQRPILKPDELYLSAADLEQRLSPLPGVSIEAEAGDASADGNVSVFETRPAPDLFIHERAKTPGAELQQFIDQFSGRVLLAADSPGRRAALQDSLAAFGLRPDPVEGWPGFVASASHFAIAVMPLEAGFVSTGGEPLAVLTEAQLFGGRLRRTTRRASGERDPESIIRSLSELREGAPVVHEDHGVGRYQGLNTLTIEDQASEFLTIEYAEGDRLYVPVASLHLVSRYTGGSDDSAPLHRMGSDRWAKAKKRAAERVRDVAAELLDLYARREARQGHAFELDRRMYEEFASTFAFEETPDQLEAIEATLDDMTSPRPMDRVICGDVGFGKTEVALRAAFVAVQGGKQVAVLVPTTLLARQHHQTFADRFADWPVRIELLSRLSGSKAAEKTVADLKDGRVDIVIGTHRLLQGQVKFADLGLVIVDEEQRFGVRQKERLKTLRAEVDLLTLTATPIPRTLNMAMSGLRDLSIIATPPPRRVAVKTLITKWQDALIREAMQREIQRGGQVYFLHNKVEDIQRMAGLLEDLVPDARMAIAHGQMPKRELEQVMAAFYRQQINVLLCTTIIENGIDVPTANTIIINRADHFGLAQLHQLRGRVGRSHHRAFAYLVVPGSRSMTADARKRLDAIASMEELGAGFTLASHDLEIRGAGELLGEDQSGQIAEVGLSLYTELLSRTVEALRAGREPDLERALNPTTEIELHVPALIPEDYLPDVPLRLTLYKRIASAADDDALRELKVEMIDRFGLLPPAVKNLFANAKLRLKAAPLGIRRLELGADGGRVDFEAEPNVDPRILIKLIQSQPHTYRLEGDQRLRILRGEDEAEARLKHAGELLARLAGNRP